MKPKHSDEPAVLVTGGSGFIGRHLVSELADQGHTVVCMYHHRLPEPRPNVYPVCSDMGSSELIAAPLRGVRTVIHLAWEGGFVGPTEKVSWNLSSRNLPKNIRLLKNLIAATEKAGTERIIFVSAIGASRDADTPFLQEKYLGEFLVLNSKIPNKIILRSAIVCGGGGSNDKFLKSIVKVMQFPAVYPVPFSSKTISPIHVEDLTRTLAHLSFAGLDQSSALIEVKGNETFKVDELFKMVSERFAKGTKFALGGVLGQSLLPFFERDQKNDQASSKLRHFLSLGSNIDKTVELKNPLLEKIPEASRSFKDVLAENQSA